MAPMLGGFAIQDLYEALDAQRVERGLSWAGVAREVSRNFDEPTRAVSASTITGTRTRRTVEGDGVLQMLVWLDRSPEDFVPGHPLAGSPETRLPAPSVGQVLRWDAAALHTALDAARRDRGLTWATIASETGGTGANLTSLARGGRVTLPFVMRPVTWLQRPAAEFTRLTPW
jgi:hypothetical protein